MAKVTLRFEKTTLKEFSLTKGVVSIGRLPDNDIQVDNPAVSGHHAMIYWDEDHFVVEDNNSLNGTFIHSERVTKRRLKDGNTISVGKHILSFEDDGQDILAGAPHATAAPLPKISATMVLDTKKARDMIAQAAAKGRTGTAAEGTADAAAHALAAHPTTGHIGAVLLVVSGKTDQQQYALLSKYSVIGKSDMASVKLKGWFAPKMAAAITRRDNKYFIAAADQKQQVKVNDQLIHGQKELEVGDRIEVAKVKMTFTYSD